MRFTEVCESYEVLSNF